MKNKKLNSSQIRRKIGLKVSNHFDTSISALEGCKEEGKRGHTHRTGPVVKAIKGMKESE
jgi:hypothetical protein